MRLRPSNRRTTSATAGLVMSLIVGASLTLFSVTSASANPTQVVGSRSALTSMWMSGFAASIGSGDVQNGSTVKVAADIPPKPYNAVLLAGDRQVEAVWNASSPQASLGYRVSLYQGSSKVAEQNVCGACTWALFSGSPLVNGKEYRASIQPLGHGGRVSHITTSAVRPTALSSAGLSLASQGAIDRAIQRVGAVLDENSPDTAGLAVDQSQGRLVAGFVQNGQFSKHAAAIKAAAPVAVRPTKYSTTQLSRLADRIAHGAKSLYGRGIRITATNVDTLANKVLVDVEPATAHVASLLAAKYGADTLILRGDRVHVRQSSNNPEGQPAPRIPPSGSASWYGGITLTDPTGDVCTAGYMTHKALNDLYLTTAGHCFPQGAIVSDLAGTAIGVVQDVKDGHNADADAETISLTFPDLATNQIIAQATSVWRNVTEEAQLFVPGTRVCFSGSESNGQKCAFNSNEGDVIFDDGSVQTGAAAAYNPAAGPVDDYAPLGDSGSAVYRALSSSSLRVYGITDGSIWIDDEEGNIEIGGFYYTFDNHLRNDFAASALTTPVP